MDNLVQTYLNSRFGDERLTMGSQSGAGDFEFEDFVNNEQREDNAAFNRLGSSVENEDEYFVNLGKSAVGDITHLETNEEIVNVAGNPIEENKSGFKKIPDEEDVILEDSKEEDKDERKNEEETVTGNKIGVVYSESVDLGKRVSLFEDEDEERKEQPGIVGTKRISLFEDEPNELAALNAISDRPKIPEIQGPKIDISDENTVIDLSKE